MADPVNLNQFRKERQRAQKRAEADANAVRFGRTKAQKEREAADAARARNELDGKRLDGTPPSVPDPS